ncbi:RNase A-like domain-containing protein [Streptomyces sp. NPDC052701]|uniref:RNase A-like domain-containing protein n=1 Tax=Streptomyces sp. NPDC052701 TaxID=3155533 RepID=UPI00343E4885
MQSPSPREGGRSHDRTPRGQNRRPAESAAYIGSSTFKDLTAAEKATADNLAANQAAIQRWLASASAGDKEPFTHAMDSSGGRIYVRATDSFVNPNRVVTVLKKKRDGSYYILTSYPEI